MKTLSCTANKSVPMYVMYTVKDDTVLQFSRYLLTPLLTRLIGILKFDI